MYHRNTNGLPLDFADKPALLELYRDRSLWIKIRKCVQVGISEWLILDTIDHCDRGLSVFYLLPTYSLRGTFVLNRINRLKDLVPYYATRFSEPREGADSTVMKHFGTGTMKFVGSNAMSEYLEFPADVVTIDEYDRCNQENLPYARDRNQAAKVKYYREVGNPTIEGEGIDKSFKDSDQKFWQLKCDSCGKWQSLDFFKNMVRQVGEADFELLDRDWKAGNPQDLRLYCQFCARPLNRLATGEWVAAQPGHPISGYHFSHLFSATVTMAELYSLFIEAQADETKKQVFFNSRLGLPYTSTGAKLNLNLLERCLGDYLPLDAATGCTAGIDVGSWLHVVVSDRTPDGLRRAVHIARYKTFEELDTMMRQFGVEVAVMDYLPETREALKFQARNQGRVFLCRYHKQPQMEEFKIDQVEQIIEADRTQSLDGSHAEILTRRRLLPKNYKSIDGGDFLAQMCAPTRVYDEEAKRYVWKEGSAPDHYRHADNYDYLASQILRGHGIYLGIMDVGPEPKKGFDQTLKGR